MAIRSTLLEAPRRRRRHYTALLIDAERAHEATSLVSWTRRVEFDVIRQPKNWLRAREQGELSCEVAKRPPFPRDIKKDLPYSTAARGLP